MPVVHFFSGVTKFPMRTITWYRNLTGRCRLIQQRVRDGCYHINKGPQQRGDGCYRTNKGLQHMLHGALQIPWGADGDVLLLLLPPSGNSCKKKVETSCGRNISLGCLQRQNWFLFWERPLGKKVMLAIRGPTPASGNSSLKQAFLFFCLIILKRVKSKASQSSENNSCSCLWDYLSFY